MFIKILDNIFILINYNWYLNKSEFAPDVKWCENLKYIFKIRFTMQTIGPPQFVMQLMKIFCEETFLRCYHRAPPVYVSDFWPDKIICDVIPENILLCDLFSMLPSAPPGEQMQFIKIIICWICSRCNHRPPPVNRCNL